MQTNLATDTAPQTEGDDGAGLLDGFRFRPCMTWEDWETGLAIRRAVYGEGRGYDVAIPDEYDRRSWLFLAEDVALGRAIGTMRATPRWGGPVEAEECFTLPLHLRNGQAAEITRFGILPAHRKGRTATVVSLGLSKLVHDFSARIGIRHLIVCAKPERMWTYEWMRFKTTGMKARHTKLGGAEHELISLDFARCYEAVEKHPLEPFFRDARHSQVGVPAHIPSPGIPMADEDAVQIAI